MKIAHVVAVFPPAIGGMGRVSFAEAERLARDGHSVTVFCLSRSDVVVPQLPFRVVTLSAWPRLGAAGFVPQLLWMLTGFDIVHLHYPFYGAIEWVWLRCYFTKQKLVVTYHMDARPVGIVARAVQWGYDRLWARPLLRQANKIIAVDRVHFLQSDWGKKNNSAKVIEVVNGVDTEVFCPGVRDLSVIGLADWSNKHIFLAVGNLLRFKRFDITIRALAQLKDTAAVLVIVGDGPERNNLVQLAAKLGVANRVRFVGSCVSPAVLASFYRAARALIVSSTHAESFSLVALEAMACGCPVIAARISGVAGRINDGVDGWLYTPAEVNDLVRVLVLSLQQSTTDHIIMTQKGRTKIETHYSWEKHVARIEEIYRSL